MSKKKKNKKINGFKFNDNTLGHAVNFATNVFKSLEINEDPNTEDEEQLRIHHTMKYVLFNALIRSQLSEELIAELADMDLTDVGNELDHHTRAALDLEQTPEESGTTHTIDEVLSVLD